VHELYSALLQLVVAIIAGAVIFIWIREGKRKESAINAILAKLAMEKMDPSERQSVYETAAQKTFKVKPDEARKIPEMLKNMTERRRLPLLALTLVVDKHPPPIESEPWRTSFADIEKAEKAVSHAISYFKEKHGIEISL
jgi:hypothetical protein